jgi:hypothetical protein
MGGGQGRPALRGSRYRPAAGRTAHACPAQCIRLAVAVAIGAIIGRGATASDTSFATSAVALVTLLVAHRVVAIGRRYSRVVRLLDHPPRVLIARGELQGKELARAGLTAADVYALLRENGVGDLGQVGYLLYETRGAVTVIGADREPGPLVRDGLDAPGYRRASGPAAGCVVTRGQAEGAQASVTFSDRNSRGDIP